MKNRKHLSLALTAFAMSVMPSFAQNEISNNQPVSREMSAEEIRIEAKLKLDFKNGLIDSNQLAQMQRDFDGILVKEDSFKARGLTDDGRKAIGEALCQFESKLDKAAGVSTTAEAQSTVQVKADQNNAGLENKAPTE